MQKQEIRAVLNFNDTQEDQDLYNLVNQCSAAHKLGDLVLEALRYYERGLNGGVLIEDDEDEEASTYDDTGSSSGISANELDAAVTMIRQEIRKETASINRALLQLMETTENRDLETGRAVKHCREMLMDMKDDVMISRKSAETPVYHSTGQGMHYTGGTSGSGYAEQVERSVARVVAGQEKPTVESEAKPIDEVRQKSVQSPVTEQRKTSEYRPQKPELPTEDDADKSKERVKQVESDGYTVDDDDDFDAKSIEIMSRMFKHKQ